jgi:hypothetical protein
MSCVNGQCYLPQPPRAWSRVQNICSLVNNTNTSPPNSIPMVRVPYSNREVPASNLGYELAMINKGNVLQYKINSSNLTKNQRYSKIAKGQWTNRTKTYATQNDRGYTNPNIHNLLRTGGQNVTLAGVPTAAPVTCPKNLRQQNNVLPSQIISDNPDQTVPPPVPPTPAGLATIVPFIIEQSVEPVVIQDFGNLVCGTSENVCTGEIIQPIQLDNCHPTTDSDVPGPIQPLCWNDGNPTWYPRQQYVMTNSTDKWPVNAPLTSAVKPTSPILSITTGVTVYTLSWYTTTTCLPITSYNVYQNDLLFANTTETILTVAITGTTNTFYVTSLNNTIESNASNVVAV